MVDTNGYVSSLVADATHLYFVSGAIVSMLPKAGGFAIELADLDCGGPIQLAVNSEHVYATCGVGSVMRVSKADGSIEAVATSAQEPEYVAADDDHVYWGESYSVHHYVPGGATESIPIDTTPGRILIADGYVYWSTRTGLSRIATNGGATQSLALGERAKDFAVVGGIVLAMLRDHIVAYSLVNDTDTTVVDVSQGSAVAVKDSYVVWTVADTVNAWPLGGGNVVKLASGITNDTPGSLIVDAATIYWIGGTSVFKLKRPW